MKYYKRVDGSNKTTTVESYSHDSPVTGAIEITKQEFDTYIATLPPVIPPAVRNLAKELDDLKAELKAKSVIS